MSGLVDLRPEDVTCVYDWHCVDIVGRDRGNYRSILIEIESGQILNEQVRVPSVVLLSLLNVMSDIAAQDRWLGIY